MRHFRTVGARLAVALVVVVAAVLLAVYLIVIPSLEDRLVNSRKDQVATVAERVAESLDNGNQPTDEFARSFANASNTRVTIFDVLSRDPLTLGDIADAGGGDVVGGITDDPVANSAAKSLLRAARRGT
jgi:hypothetical protein